MKIASKSTEVLQSSTIGAPKVFVELIEKKNAK